MLFRSGGKQFDEVVLTKYEPKLRDQILTILKKRQFDSVAEEASKTVAADLGRVCAMLTTGTTVSKDTFQAVFELMRDHPKCPQPGAGAGAWCDIPL